MRATEQVRGVRTRRRAVAVACFVAVFVLPVGPPRSLPGRFDGPTASAASGAVAGALSGAHGSGAPASSATGGGAQVLAATMERPVEAPTPAPVVEPAPVEVAPVEVPTIGRPEAPPTTAAPVPVEPPPEPPPAVVLAPPVTSAPALARAVEGLSSAERRDVASQALGMIVYDWQGSLPGWEIRFLDARAGYRGLTYPEERVVEVYVRSSDTPSTLAHVVAHELGHAVDVTWFGVEERSAWIAARGVDPRVSWFVEAAGSDFASGAGDFAESFAWWQVGGPTWFGELAAPPSDEQLAVLARLVLGG